MDDENGLTLSAIILAGFTLHFYSQLLGVVWKHTTTKHTVGWLSVLHDQYPASYRCSLVANTVALSASLLIILLRITGLLFKPGTFLWETRLLMFIACIALAVLYFVSSPLFYV